MWQRWCPGFKKGSKWLSVAVWCPFDCVKWMRCRRCFIGLGCELIIKIIRLDFVNIIYHTLSKGNRCSSAIINCVPCHQLEIKLMIPANKFNCCRSREKEKHFTSSWEVRADCGHICSLLCLYTLAAKGQMRPWKYHYVISVHLSLCYKQRSMHTLLHGGYTHKGENLQNY